MSGAKDLTFIGREFHKLGKEFWNNRSVNFSLVEQVEVKDTHDLRNVICWEFDYTLIFMSL